MMADKDKRIRRALIVRRARAMRERAKYAARSRYGASAGLPAADEAPGFGLLTADEEDRIDSLAAALAEVSA
jgi:hypothetical protein